MVKRKRYDSQFKATVALEAVKNQKTISQIASDYSIHPNQVGKWKKQLLEGLPQVFTNRQNGTDKESEKLIDEFYRQIGQLKVELDWLKKKSQRSLRLGGDLISGIFHLISLRFLS